MTDKLDMERIADALGAERRGPVTARGGYFGALNLLADIEARFRVPAGGGRPTDAGWTERRLIPVAPRTLRRLREIAGELRKLDGVRVEPMQLAALLLERATEKLGAEDLDDLARSESRSEELG